jgi:hypothetical protein
MAAKAVASVPSRYSTSAQMTPPTLAINPARPARHARRAPPPPRAYRGYWHPAPPALSAAATHAGVNHVRPRRRDPEVAGNVDYRVAAELAPARVVVQRSALALERDQRGDIEAVVVRQRSLRVAGPDQHRALLGEKPCHMLADRAEPLDHRRRAGCGRGCAASRRLAPAPSISRSAARLSPRRYNRRSVRRPGSNS